MADKKLITLIDSDKSAINDFLKKYPAEANGIECPNCGEELWDEHKGFIFGAPAKTYTYCAKCQFNHIRYV